MIQTVIFDMGNVLIHFDHERACRQIAELSGASSQQVREVIFDSGLQMQFEAGKISAQDLYQHINQTLPCRLDQQTLQNALCDIFWAKPEMEQLIGEVKSLGYRTVLLSNVCDLHFEFIRQTYQFLNHIDEQILSYQVGECKPHPLIYQKAIEAAKAPANRCLFIDDVFENIAAAEQQGLLTHHFLGKDALVAQMRQLGMAI